MEQDKRTYVDALIFWSGAALTSAERVLRIDRDFSPWSGSAAPQQPRKQRVPEADAALMLLALRNLVRAAAWTVEELRPNVGEELDRALDGFNDLLPGLIDARDALEHFDEYAVGRGRLQRRSPDPYEFHLTLEGERPVVTVGPIRVDVEHAREACRWLVISLLGRVPIDDPERAERILAEVLAQAKHGSCPAAP